MIYLIDDKKNRQEIDYGWSAERLQNFSSVLTPVYTYEEIKRSELREDIFFPGNIILFHESFFDNTINIHDKDSVDIRSELNKHATDKKGWVVFFSGSKSSRTLENRVAHIPVSVLYTNLEAFIEKVSENLIDLRYLVYGGKNPEIEAELLNKLMLGNNQCDETPIISDQKNFLAFAGSRINIPIILEGAIERTFTPEEKYEKQITQSYLDDKVKEWLSDQEVDNIFIPLCFGPSLSDYNGLQFACHIRCTNTMNRLKPIFIYSFVDYSYPIDCEYFNILKTKGISLIEYSRSAFEDAISKRVEPLRLEQLRTEMQKLKLDAPKNYEDDHSIANEWAIYRWALAIGANDAEIEKVTEKINGRLYFKYLQSLFPKPVEKLLGVDQLKVNYTGRPKILYIDDDADKGWYEIFCKILYDFNGLSFEHLDEEFNSKTQDEIIDTSVNKIFEDGIDLVILDFRLHSNDFHEKNIKQVTGYKLLEKIKNLNPGIQVIIFSATNKIWNYLALQEAGANGFILKESPENSSNHLSSITVQEEMCSVVGACLEKSFLKEFYDCLAVLNAELIPRKNKRSAFPLPKEFVDEVLKWLELSYKSLNDGLTHYNLTASFLLMFSVLENLANRIIDVDNPIPVPNSQGLYKFSFRIENKRLSNFIEDENNSGFYRRTKNHLVSKKSIPWFLKILNAINYITKEQISEDELSLLIKKRNEIIHANTTTGDKIEIDRKLIITLNSLIYKGLKEIK